MMATHPNIQSRAHQEIMAVCGSPSLPGPEDRSELPFVECIIREVHRINPAVPLIPHSNSQEDMYSGYRIPKNSWIIANIWWAKLYGALIWDLYSPALGGCYMMKRYMISHKISLPKDFFPVKLALSNLTHVAWFMDSGQGVSAEILVTGIILMSTVTADGAQEKILQIYICF